MAYPDPSMPFVMNELGAAALPEGDYTITVEASDLAGNMAEPIVRDFTVAGGAADTGDGGDDVMTTAGTNDSGPVDTGVDDTGGPVTNATTPDDDATNGGDVDVTGDLESSGEDAGTNDNVIDRGCGCTTNERDDAALLLLGVAGLALTRRARRRTSGSATGSPKLRS
jgi:MYXO-CTERM domain-containing protein